VHQAAASTDPFRAISEGNRRALLDVLRDGDAPVGELVEATGLSYSLVYRLDAKPLRVVHDWTGEYERFWQERIGRLRRRLDER
jgi:hypothetical protein